MIKAYQIVDFNNPISVDYFKYSVRSFNTVKDLVQIEQVQCTVPETIPSDVKLDPSKKRSRTEEAVLISHYLLIKRMANGERFIVLEHDAYLWPDKVDMFKIMLNKIDTTAVWISGIAMECYTMNQQVAKIFCDIVESDFNHEHRGPMTILHQAGNIFCKENKTRVVWPLYGETGKLVFADNVSLASSGKGKMNEAPVTQYVNTETGVTVERPGRSINKKNNPNVHFGDDKG